MISMDRSESASSGNQNSDDIDQKCTSAKKICRVCGDKALSINFNVITCESCKAFFRRNALKPKEFRCPLNGRCQINIATRRQCKKCRLEKCFQVGMVKDFIMSEEARTRKRHLIEENRAKRRMVIERKLLYDGQPNDSELRVKCEDTAPENGDFGGIDFMDFNQMDDLQSPDNQYNTDTALVNFNPFNLTMNSDDTISMPKSVLTALINQCHDIGSFKSCNHPYPPMNGHRQSACRMPMLCTCRCLCGASTSLNWPFNQQHDIHCDRYSSSSVSDHRSDQELALIPVSKEITTLSQHELMKILYTASGVDFETGSDGSIRFDYGISAVKSSHFEMLRNAFTVMYDRWDDVLAKNKSSHIGINHYVDSGQELTLATSQPTMMVMLERYNDLIRRFVKMCSKITALRCLNTNDQMILVKNGILDFMMLRGVHAYMPEVDGWSHTSPMAPPSPVAMLKRMGDAYQIFLKVFYSFPRSFINDEKIFCSLIAMFIFEPNRPGIVDKASIQIIREFYQNMLYQYLKSSYGDDVGHEMMSQVNRVMEMVSLKSSFVSWHTVVEVDPTSMEPLLIEITKY